MTSTLASALIAEDTLVNRQVRWAAVPALVLALSCGAALAQQDASTRVTQFTYHPTTGMLLSEQVDPGGTHCVETAYAHDSYGNRERVTVRPCQSTSVAASFTARVTVNEFGAGTNHPAGAYVTRSRTGTEVSPGVGIVTMAESKATFDARFGAPLTGTEVALNKPDGTRDLSKRTTYDPLGRVEYEYAPVDRNITSNVVTEVRSKYTTVYCQGPLATGDGQGPPPPPNPGCINIPDQTVLVSYASMRLVDTAGVATGTAVVRLKTAYFLESTPQDNAGTSIGARSRVHFDALHREFAKETESYDGRWVRTLTGYDQLGMAAVSWGQHFSTGNTAPPNELRQWTAERDLLHRPLSAKQFWRGAAGTTAVEIEGKAEYNGLSVTAVVPGDSAPDGQVRRRTTRKNAVGQTIQTEDPYGATLNSAYDGFGNLVQTKDPLGNTTTIAYTAVTARFKTGMTDPDRGTWAYVYDALGQLKTQTDANYKTTTLTYDALGRMTDKVLPGFEAHWRYRVNNEGTPCADGLSRLCESWTGPTAARSTQRQLIYDPLGRATQVRETLDRLYTSSTTFDTLGRPSTYQYPSGLALKYSYSAAAGKTPGYLVTVADNSNSARKFWDISEFAQPFDARGNLLQQRLGNGVATAHVMDSVSGKAFGLVAGAAGSSNNVLNQGYIYDKSHNLVSRTNGFNGGSEAFGYDLLDRLVTYTVDSANIAAKRTVTVGYNGIGNILTKSDVGGYQYTGSKPHAVSTAGGTSYVYDGNGNLLSSTGAQVRTHTWTDFNLPNTMAYNGTTVAFKYDDGLKRVEEITTTGSTQRKLWLVHPDNASGLAFEREETVVNGVLTRNENRHYISVGGAVIGVVKTLNANVLGNLVANAVVSSDANMTQYWHKDSLGSIVAITNGVATVTERPGFDAWGRRLYEDRTVNATSVGAAHGDRGYTGHEHLDELGLVHMNGRVYDPVLARFLSADPVIQSPGDLQNYNLYSYVLNNPLRYTDPNGEFYLEIAMFIVGAIMAHEGNQYWSMVGRLMMMYALSSPDGGLVESGLGNAAELNGVNGAMNLGMEASVFNAGSVGNAMLSSAIATAASPGSSGQDIFLSAATAAAFNGAGGLGTPEARIGAHMLIGCVQGAMSGGKCGPSAMAALAGKVATEGLPGNVGVVERGLVTSLAGGTASVIGGGKFANGAYGAAVGYLFNFLSVKRTAWVKQPEGGVLPEVTVELYLQTNPGLMADHLDVEVPRLPGAPRAVNLYARFLNWLNSSNSDAVTRGSPSISTKSIRPSGASFDDLVKVDRAIAAAADSLRLDLSKPMSLEQYNTFVNSLDTSVPLFRKVYGGKAENLMKFP